MRGKTVHIASRVDALQLLVDPDIVMQQLSLKIVQRRQQLVDELIGTKVEYRDLHGNVCLGTVKQVNPSTVVIAEKGKMERSIALRNLL